MLRKAKKKKTALNAVFFFIHKTLPFPIQQAIELTGCA
ncbi:hypothetical protein BQ1740_4110 [Bacillus subtilis]|nr:hypothetical protein BQ1740_4110 [Bacillus subtilis]